MINMFDIDGFARVEAQVGKETIQLKEELSYFATINCLNHHKKETGDVMEIQKRIEQVQGLSVIYFDMAVDGLHCYLSKNNAFYLKAKEKSAEFPRYITYKGELVNVSRAPDIRFMMFSVINLRLYEQKLSNRPKRKLYYFTNT